MNLHAWLSYIEQKHPNEIDLQLDRVKSVFDKLNINRIAKTVITIAGTNGKGSCIALLSQCLQLEGLSVGCYTSPHLIEFNERIVIDSVKVFDADLCQAFQRIDDIAEDIQLTYFEYTTLAALIVFSNTSLDAVILEVGMGGRLDAVNIIDPDIAIITSIALDHQQWLGDNREAIAEEKAGVLRPGIIAIIGDRDCPLAIKSIAKDMRVKLSCLGENFDFEHGLIQKNCWRWCGESDNGEFISLENLPKPTILLDNAATVLQALQFIKGVSSNTIVNALEQVYLLGRCEASQLNNGSTLILDVAHNPAATQNLVNYLQEEHFIGQTYVIFGVMKDKDWQTMLSLVDRVADYWLLTELAMDRALSTHKVVDYLSSMSKKNVETYANVLSAYRSACNIATINDRIVVFGSFYTVAPVLQVIHAEDKVSENE